MQLSQLMSSKVVTLRDNDSLGKASAMMKEHGIRHFPVVNDAGNLVGIVTDRDLKRASASNATSLEVHELLYLLEKLLVKEVMSKPPITVAPEQKVQEAARLMVDKKIGCLPVMDKNQLLGVVTQIDLLGYLASH